MTDLAIRVENLSKLYTIGRAQQRHDTPSTRLRTGLRDALVNALPRILRPGSGQVPRISRKGNANSSNSRNSWQEETNLWALKDVSFEACPECNRRVQRGEVVGVPSTKFTLSAVEVLRAGIGRNGAGKSTAPFDAAQGRAEDSLAHHRADQQPRRDLS
jgi:ABC-type polysaccharide/polyol phosphate transport system ATPase subunit